ncbi:MAG: hypothetical protein EBY60_07820 [Actinobacteria bacterium]|nr:hypothetical protein [Actinomycetota bacterium]
MFPVPMIPTRIAMAAIVVHRYRSTRPHYSCRVPGFLSDLTGSFSTSSAQNPTVAIISPPKVAEETDDAAAEASAADDDKAAADAVKDGDD